VSWLSILDLSDEARATVIDCLRVVLHLITGRPTEYRIGNEHVRTIYSRACQFLVKKLPCTPNKRTSFVNFILAGSFSHYQDRVSAFLPRSRSLSWNEGHIT
jgi:hypothetical protein